MGWKKVACYWLRKHNRSKKMINERIEELKALATESPASQDWWEMWQMLKHVDEISPMVIVEIGVDGGGSLETWKKAFDPEIMVGIDILQRKEHEPYTMVYADSRTEEAINMLKEKLGGRKIDFLFIDGDHNYETVKKEFQMYSSLVRDGGIIGFHDTNGRGIAGVTVDKFMRELDEMHTYRTADYFAGKNTPGTRVLFK